MGKELSRIVLVVLVVALSSMLALPGSAPAARKPHLSFYGNVAVVATKGGDYADPASAMADYSSWCGTPSATNLCLVKIMPGVYTVTSPVVMQPYIDIEGSGEMVTKITGALSTPELETATVEGASHAELRFVTVENTGTYDYTVAILNSSQSPSLLHVTATASGGGESYGVYNDSSSSPSMTDVRATALGVAYSYGVFNYYSSPTMTDVRATASGGTNSYGVYNKSSSSPTMTNVTASASGGGESYGVYNDSSSSPTMTDVRATASGGTNSYGVYNSDSSGTVKINQSVIKGTTNSIYNSSGVTTYVGGSQLDGSSYNAGTLTCVGAYDADYVALSNTCQ